MTARYRHSLPFGAELQPDGQTMFRHWAPAQQCVNLVLNPGPRESLLPMERAAGGWFTAMTDQAPAGARYHYALGDGQRVPDPASRFQPDDVHAPSEVVDPRAYVWRTADWQGRPWEEVVLYEAHVGCFSPEGTYDGMRARLDHLVTLGVTALELMPLSDFEGRRNWGYDGVLPFAPDSSYGRPDDLKRLIDEAHARGLMVFLDVVYNHFGPSGNYLRLYAPGFFTERYDTPWGAAMNFEDDAAEVRRFFIENAKYWIQEYRFDGLRFDAVHAILDASTPHVMEEIATAVRDAVDPGRHVHLVVENVNNASRFLARTPRRLHDAQWNDDYYHAVHVLSTGETYGHFVDYAPGPVAALAKCLGSGFFFQGEASGHLEGKPRGEDSRHLPATAFVNFIQNHDQVGNRADAKRIAALIPEAPLRALTAITLLSPPVPMLFMGEEWASRRPFHFFCDFTGDLADAVREGRKREFAHMRERDPAAKAFENIDPNAESTFVDSKLDWNASEGGAHAAFLSFVRELLTVRRRHIVPRLAGMPHRAGLYDVRDGRALRVRWDLGGGTRLTLVANLSDLPIDELGWSTPGRQLYPARDSAASLVDALAPWGVCVYLAEVEAA